MAQSSSLESHSNASASTSFSSNALESSGPALTIHSFLTPGSIQATIASTLKISPALLDRTKRDIRLAYSKYEAIHDAIRQINLMASAGTWTQKVPTNDEFIEIFVSKSNYFRYYNNSFSQIPNDSPIQKWLRNGSDAPSTHDIWGSNKPTFENLKVILEGLSGNKKKSGGKKVTKGKGEKKDRSSKKKGQAL